MTRRRGLMKFDVFRSIIDDFKENDHKPEIFFNFSGEPTLNPALPDFIAYAHAHGHKTFVSTNATKIDRKLSEKMIAAGLRRIYLCLDGFDKEGQEAYRVNSDFDEVKANIEAFVDVRRELGRDNPLCILQTLLTRYSEKYVEEIKNWARKIGIDQIRFKTFSTGTYTSAEEKELAEKFLPQNPEYRRNLTDRKTLTCDEPLHSTLVFWDGDLGLCCIDYDKKIALPNIKQGGFLKAYLSDEAARARRDGYLKKHDICQDCSYSNAENMGFTVKFER